jgi:hypothetical protein
MPMVRLSNDTIQLLRQQTTPGFTFVRTAKRREDGDWDVPVDDEVAFEIAVERLPGESDDDCVARLVRAAIGKTPN